MVEKHTHKKAKPSAQRHGRTIPDSDDLATDDRGTTPDRLRAGTRPYDTQSEHPDSVETGTPVPENDRTTRATGETGEDEDLPDDGGTETERGNIVRSPRNFDDGPA
jgi:hypothetical protein